MAIIDWEAVINWEALDTLSVAELKQLALILEKVK
jgi:hypothetical protein